METVRGRPEVEYPERDGRPMAESDAHRDEMQSYAIEVLQDHYARDRNVYVTGNNFVYFTEGVREDCVSPDTYVVKGVRKRRRPSFKVWEEGGKVPCFVLEVTSRSTRREDMGDKMAKYRDDLGVREYFLFDLTGDWIEGKLRAYRLEKGAYLPVAPLPSGRLRSAELGLEVAVQGGHLRFFERGAAEPLATRVERAERESERARAESERARAESERARVESERARAESERADRAEAEVARLRAEVERLKRKRQGGP